MVYSWLLAFRFKTLTAAVVPVLVATCLALAVGQFHGWWVSICALLGAFAIQIATNLLNDAIDFKKGADTEHRLGPQRVTQSGLLTEKQVFFMGLFFLLLAVGFGFPLVLRGGFPIIGLGLVSLFLAYGYTGGPFPLAYLGLGDLFVVLFFGLFAVGGTYYLQSLEMTDLALVAGLQVGCLSTVLIAINNLRDSQTDVLVHKKTLAVRFGDNFVRFEIVVLMILIYGLSFYYFLFLQKPWTLLSFLTLPLALILCKIIFKTDEKKKLNKALGLAALHQMAFGVLLSIGLLL